MRLKIHVTKRTTPAQGYKYHYVGGNTFFDSNLRHSAESLLDERVVLGGWP
jgi:hypothetical protein